jgi:hypothetical protein
MHICQSSIWHRALALRRIVIAKMRGPTDELGYKFRKLAYEAKGAEDESEAQVARTLITAIIWRGPIWSFRPAGGA